MPQQSPSMPCGTITRQPAFLSRDNTTSGSDGASSCWPNTRLAQDGIRINAVSPGQILTPMLKPKNIGFC